MTKGGSWSLQLAQASQQCVRRHSQMEEGVVGGAVTHHLSGTPSQENQRSGDASVLGDAVRGSKGTGPQKTEGIEVPSSLCRGLGRRCLLLCCCWRRLCLRLGLSSCCLLPLSLCSGLGSSRLVQLLLHLGVGLQVGLHKGLQQAGQQGQDAAILVGMPAAEQH